MEKTNKTIIPAVISIAISLAVIYGIVYVAGKAWHKSNT